MDTFHSANVGIVGGHGVTCIDVDHPSLVGYAIERYGETPLQSLTPSGGSHLWYKSNGERRRIRHEGLQIDVLGIGGFGVAPPSSTPKGDYRFITGSVEDIPSLPTMKNVVTTAYDIDRSLMVEGSGRNNDLLRALLGPAWEATTFEELLKIAFAINKIYRESMEKTEVSKAAVSVWGYKLRGTLIAPGTGPHGVIAEWEFELLKYHKSALCLLMGLRAKLGAVQGNIYFPQQCAEIYGMSPITLRSSQHTLENLGFIEVIRRGVQGKRRCTLIRLVRREAIASRFNQMRHR